MPNTQEELKFCCDGPFPVVDFKSYALHRRGQQFQGICSRCVNYLSNARTDNDIRMQIRFCQTGEVREEAVSG